MAKRALIADEDSRARDLLARHLSCWGYDVDAAADGLRALGFLEGAKAPRVVLLDADLPVLGSLDLCRRIRELRGDDTFVLVMTTPDRKADQLDALEAGADGVIEKPVNARELKMRLAAGMRGRRLAVSQAPSSRPLSTRDPSDDSLVGRVVAGKYQIERLIGKGGMGTVWQGTHLSLGMRVAIKFIKGDYARHSIARARFELEARASARLRTKYAVKVFDYGVTDGGLPYLVMEYLEGPSLLQRVQSEGALSFAETVTLIAQSAHALSQAHAAGIIHRDVKPDNVLLVADPDAVQDSQTHVAKLIDFGVAKVLVESDASSGATGAGAPSMSTQSGIVVGTPNFMPPEQLRGNVSPGIATDLWGLAVCAFTAITGRIPFEGSTLSEVVRRVCDSPLPVPSAFDASIPPEFDGWFAKACHQDPAKRFRSARELASALAQVYADHADSVLDMRPSLSLFVAAQFTTEAASSSRLRIFELDEPMSATAP